MRSLLPLLLLLLLPLSGRTAARQVTPDGAAIPIASVRPASGGTAAPAVAVPGVQSPDSLQLAQLDRQLDAFFAALENEPVAVKNAEADFLIGSCTTDAVRNHVAIRIYDHYLQSRRMGDEGVAVYLADNWFSTGKVHFLNEIDAMNARIYAEFNRASLIGEPAPELRARTPDGGTADIPACSAGRVTVLYLYDTDCAKCKLETMLLRHAFAEKNFPVDFIAFYTGDDAGSWERYRAEQLVFEAPSLRMIHAWDQDFDTDFQRLYGVLQTPRMFLLDRQGVIIGRGLDTQALMQMLEALFPAIDYGSEASVRLYDEIFGALEPSVSVSDVRAVGERIAAMTAGQGDTLLYKQMTGDLLLYLSGRRGEGYKAGTVWVADSLVLACPQCWTTQEDSLQVLSLAGWTKELAALAPVGSRLPDLKVPGRLVTAKGGKSVRKSLRKVGGRPSYILFYTRGCELCRAERASVAALLRAEPKARVLEVDFDGLSETEPALAERLLQTFDLSALPFVIQTDRKGRILRKYLTLQR